MSRASSDALDALHGLIASTLTAQVKAKDVDSKTLAVAIKFLKDNGVDAPATSPRFSSLVEELRGINVDDLPAN